MHDLRKALVVAVLPWLIANQSVVADELSGHIGVFNNYLWRGVSASADGPAVQGGLDYATHTGAYIGTWFSNLSDNQGYQVDLYAGMKGKLKAVSIDMGLLRLTYPQWSENDSTEIYTALGYGIASIGVWAELQSARRSDNALGSFYLDSNLIFDLPNMNGVTAKLHAGYWLADQAEENFDNYFDYGIAIRKSTHLGQFSLGMFGNSLAHDERSPLSAHDLDPKENPIRFSDRPRVVVGWSKRFDF